MKKVIYLLAFCLLVSLQAMAQQTVRGVIKATDNTALISASVVATDENGAKKVIVSDADGIFTLELATGDYTIDISYIGFIPYRTDVTVSSGTNVDLGTIMLEESSQLLQSVEVVGEKITTVTILSRDLKSPYLIDSFHKRSLR
ncbi:MAG: carboxypeptidase regulatory-like domain-containing protein [Bacteroidota bacterium]